MFLANENFPKPSIILLRDAGYLVSSIQEDSPGIADERVLQIATANRQIILTFDRDYGEIIFRYQLPDPPAVVYFREKVLILCLQDKHYYCFSKKNEIMFTDSFTVIEKDSIRQRPYRM
ncbi:MAG TPA: DUF5615 family PIN-like protein [Flavisolibacter sp.]